MIQLMLKNIFENSNKIDTLVKRVSKLDKYNMFMFAILLSDIYLLAKLSKKHDKEIKELKSEFEELKSKGE